jgi:hypothetical protein
MFPDWLRLKARTNSLSSGEVLKCPECQNDTVDFQYVGDSTTRMGYLAMWCRSCKKGVHLSRVSIPKGVALIALDAPQEVIRGRIPDFEQITPD